MWQFMWPCVFAFPVARLSLFTYTCIGLFQLEACRGVTERLVKERRVPAQHECSLPHSLPLPSSGANQAPPPRPLRAGLVVLSAPGAIEARTPLGRIGDPTDDIGGVVAFLAGPDSGYVSGQTIVCDGGSFLGL